MSKQIGEEVVISNQRVLEGNDGAMVIESTLQNSPVLIIEMSFWSLCFYCFI